MCSLSSLCLPLGESVRLLVEVLAIKLAYSVIVIYNCLHDRLARIFEEKSGETMENLDSLYHRIHAAPYCHKPCG